MSEVEEDRIDWLYILRADAASVRIGRKPFYQGICLIAAEPMDDDPESHRVAGLINGLSGDRRFGFLCLGHYYYDYDYDPPRYAREDCFRKRMAEVKIVGFPEEYTLEYLSPPDEVYKPETDSERREREEFQKGITY